MWKAGVVLAVTAALVVPAAAQAASGDAAATAAYLRADYALARTGAAKLPMAKRTLDNLLARERSECAGAAAGTPQDEESTLLSDELIGTMVLSVDHVVAGPIHTFVHATQHLHWHNGAANRAVHEYVSHLRTMIGLAVPSLCSDVRTWASNVRAHRSPPLLPAQTRSFAPRFMGVWVAFSDQPPALVHVERGAARSLGTRAARLEAKIEEFEANAVETYRLLMNNFELWP